jgi:hypothetical protein
VYADATGRWAVAVNALTSTPSASVEDAEGTTVTAVECVPPLKSCGGVSWVSGEHAVGVSSGGSMYIVHASTARVVFTGHVVVRQLSKGGSGRGAAGLPAGDGVRTLCAFREGASGDIMLAASTPSLLYTLRLKRESPHEFVVESCRCSRKYSPIADLAWLAPSSAREPVELVVSEAPWVKLLRELPHPTTTRTFGE